MKPKLAAVSKKSGDYYLLPNFETMFYERLRDYSEDSRNLRLF